MFLSIVIPAYNEEARLPATLEQVLRYIERRLVATGAADSEPAEILVVNDGSRDRTAEVVKTFASRAGSHIPVRLLQNPGNKGKGFSVRHGMLVAQGEWILFTDADLSSPIEECDKLLEAARSGGFDIAIGSRGVDRSLIGVHQSFFRENAGRVFNALMRLATGLPFKDTQCGFKLFRSGPAGEIFRRQRLERFGFDVEVLYLAQKLGFHAIEVPVRWNHSEGTKVSMMGDSLDMFLDLWRVRRFDRAGYYTAPPRSGGMPGIEEQPGSGLGSGSDPAADGMHSRDSMYRAGAPGPAVSSTSRAGDSDNGT